MAREDQLAVRADVPDQPVPQRRLAGWIGSLLLGTTAVSVVAGYAGADGPLDSSNFDATLAALVATAIGTIVLAGFTGALSWATRSDVRQTRELVDLTRADQEARDRPVVTVEIRCYSPAQSRRTDDGTTWTGRETGRLKATVVNAGLGPALDVRIAGRTATGTTVREKSVPVVMPGERADISLDVSVDWGGPPGGTDTNTAETMQLWGDYTDRRRGRRYGILWMLPDGTWDEAMPSENNWKGALAVKEPT